eukprot:4622315-Alexandrium_andersonii.AAC.1
MPGLSTSATSRLRPVRRVGKERGPGPPPRPPCHHRRGKACGMPLVLPGGFGQRSRARRRAPPLRRRRLLAPPGR